MGVEAPDVELCLCYISLAKAYQANKEWDNALVQLTIALKIDQQVFGRKSWLNSEIYFTQGQIYLAKKNYLQALSSYQLALKRKTLRSISKSVYIRIWAMFIMT